MPVPIPRFVRRALRDAPMARTIAGRLGLLQNHPFAEDKRERLERIRPLLRTDMPHNTTPGFYDYLSPALQRRFHITSTDNISANAYDEFATALIDECRDGVVLDCGAGYRSVMLDNVVNFEICSYPSTDVRGVGEKLPFKDNSFDGVLSLSVLEHVRDPFACAREIARVLKPGGKLYSSIPFLQPLHGYPSHYFNMTHQGHKRLYEDMLEIDRQEVTTAGQPVFTLTWFLSRWLDQLPEAEREVFAHMRVGDITARPPIGMVQEPWCTLLPKDAQFELASSTALFATKSAKRPSVLTRVRGRISGGG